MKKFSIKCTGSNMEEALKQISELSDLTLPQRNCLSLLTEEMFSMMSNVLSNKEATFAIAKEDKLWTLTMAIDTFVDLNAREKYLSLASDGKNLSHKGLKGLLNAFFDALAVADAAGAAGAVSDFAPSWQMSQYLNNLTENDRAEAWDGLERSIIANFADDVLVGVTDNKVKVIVKKSF